MRKVNEVFELSNNSEQIDLFESESRDKPLFDIAKENGRWVVKRMTACDVARQEEERLEQVRKTAEAWRQKRSEPEQQKRDDEERSIWYDIMDRREMAEELGDIAETWFLEWALAVYKDHMVSDAISEASREHQMYFDEEFCEVAVE